MIRHMVYAAALIGALMLPDAASARGHHHHGHHHHGHHHRHHHHHHGRHHHHGHHGHHAGRHAGWGGGYGGGYYGRSYYAEPRYYAGPRVAPNACWRWWNGRRHWVC